MRRLTCSGCGSENLRLILNLGTSPIADAYTPAPDLAAERYPLRLGVCGSCQLVQLLDVLPMELLFGTGYSFYSSSSAPLSAYHADYARQLRQAHPQLAGRLVVEVGCNDGDMLRHFADWPHVGVDPAPGPVEAARSRGLSVINRAFTPTVAAEIRDLKGPAALIVANHVLAHVEDVAEVLRAADLLLAADGLLYVEVQYLPDLIMNNAVDLVYHEHRNFFSLTSLVAAAGRRRLWPVWLELTDRQGGSIRVVFRRQRADAPFVDQLLASERWLTEPGAYGGMQGRAERLRARMRQLLEDAAARDEQVMGYGAPAKATTLLAWCAVGAELLPYVTDTTAAKQGRYIPGSGVVIRPPHPNLRMPGVDVAVLLSWTYARDILRRHVGFTARGGKWLIPIPTPVLL